MEPPAPCLVFATGLRTYAVPSAVAQEIVTFKDLTALPGAAPHLRGLLALRGEVLPVVDPGILSGGGPTEADRVIVLRPSRGAFALLTTRVLGVLSLEGEGRLLGDRGFAALLTGPFRAGGEDVARIEVEGLFDLLSQSGSSAT